MHGHLNGNSVPTVKPGVNGKAPTIGEPKEGLKLPGGFRYDKNGSIEFLVPRKREDEDEEWAWLCSPLEVLAETRSEDEKGWGLLIRVKTPDGVWHTQAMPRSLFLAEGGEVFALLFNLGLKITAAKAGKDRLRALLCMSSSRKRSRTATRVGWYSPRTFILPDEAFGECGDEHIVYQPEHPIPHAYKLKGSLDGWRGEVAARAIGNSRLAFAASVAFAGPLLQPLCIEGGGFHMRGDGSCGKTTALWIAGSAWGGGPMAGFLQSWRTTDNGLEARAVQHSDTFLPMDELGQAAAASAAKTIYMVANGQGKQRAGIAGEGRPVAEFRVLFLSTGEVSLTAKLAEDGLSSMAGQETRFVDLEADAGGGIGAFEDIHGAETAAAFSDAIKAAGATHYGHASRAFLRRLLAEPEEAFSEARCLMSAFVTHTCPNDATGQVARVAKRFAIVAASGEIAVQWGILPWPEGHAMEACKRMFKEWLNRRGSTGALESLRALDQVRAIIEKHGEFPLRSMGPGAKPGSDHKHPHHKPARLRPAGRRAGNLLRAAADVQSGGVQGARPGTRGARAGEVRRHHAGQERKGGDSRAPSGDGSGPLFRDRCREAFCGWRQLVSLRGVFPGVFISWLQLVTWLQH